MEDCMTLDDVYGAEHDRFPLEQELERVAPALEWDEKVETDGAEMDSGAGDRRRRRAAGGGTARAPVAVLLQAPRRAA